MASSIPGPLRVGVSFKSTGVVVSLGTPRRRRSVLELHLVCAIKLGNVLFVWCVVNFNFSGASDHRSLDGSRGARTCCRCLERWYLVPGVRLGLLLEGPGGAGSKDEQQGV